MNMKSKPKRIWILPVILVVLLLAAGVCALTPAGKFGLAMVNLALDGLKGPEIVASAWSPDMEFEAYVVDWPSIDPPNQSLYIQRRDEHNFILVAKLTEDVDSIRSIHWSPSADMVVFLTYNYLYAVHTPGFETAAVPLADEFYHYQPGKTGTFGGGIPQKSVSEVAFPEKGVFTYLLEGEQVPRTVRMAEMFGYQP